MIVFDGSGSMWGRLDGDKKQSKLELGREALRASLAKVSPSARYGLVSFGHRRAGDCNDVEVVAPLAVGDPSRIIAPLEKLNPRGRGPVVGALREAVKALGAGSQSSILLVHDNADNCRQDACELATEIAASHPRLKIHLVTLGIDADELERTVCLAKATGGRLFDIRDATGVAAAIDDAVKAAFGDAPVAKPLVSAAAAVVLAPVPPAIPSGPPGLSLSAKLSASARPLGVPVRWRVLKPDGETVAYEGLSSQALAPVEAGTYVVEGRAGLAMARFEATAADKGPTPVALTLDAAAVRVTVRDAKDGPPSSTALATLRRTGAGEPNARPVWIGRAQDADFVLPAGAYTLHIQDSLIERDEAFTVAAGETVTRDVVLGAGRLELTAVTRPDGPAADAVTYLIAKDDPDAPEGRREIARSAAARPAFVLPAGTYYVTARSGPIEVRQRVGIGAGDVVKKVVSLGLAKVVVAAEAPVGKAASQSPVGKQPLSVRVLSLEGEPREIARGSALAPEFTLSAGRYRIEAAIGGLNVKAVQDIDVEAGSARRVALKLDANTVTLKLAGSAGDVTWELKDAKGTLVARSSQAVPSFVVAPGRYTARCTVQGKASEKTVDIVAEGPQRTVEFAMP
jgi:Ca-activated chloride channel homolog